MTASVDHCSRCLTRLRGMVRLPKDMVAADLDMQLADYIRALGRFAPQDVENGCIAWAERSKWWPALADLLDAVRDAQAAREGRAAIRGRRASGDETFVERCQRLGFHAGRMSEIGVANWGGIFDHDREHGMQDPELIAALQWCEQHRNRPWKLAPKPVTAETIQETCRLVEDVRRNPGQYLAAPSVIEMGEYLIARHIAAGRAPDDVVSWYGHTVERYPDLRAAA